ncbi:hypothetical protein Bbelb_281710 [Branchiostoma belcheri]|nr:hypothetical protein Bbelb_281710 [Branchiostoma belcheri]
MELHPDKCYVMRYTHKHGERLADDNDDPNDHVYDYEPRGRQSEIQDGENRADFNADNDDANNHTYDNDYSNNRTYNDYPDSHMYHNDDPDSHMYNNDDPDSHAYNNDDPDSHVYNNDGPDSHAYNNDDPDRHVYNNDYPDNHVSNNEAGGRQPEDGDDEEEEDIHGFAKRCRAAFHRQRLLCGVTIAIAVATLFGAGLSAVIFITLSSESDAGIHSMKEVPVVSPTAFVWSTTSYTKSPAAETLLETGLPLTGTEVPTVLPEVPTVLPKVTTVLPKVTTMLPKVTTVLPKVTTVLSKVTTVLSKVTTVLPVETTVLSHVTTTKPVVTPTPSETLPRSTKEMILNRIQTTKRPKYTISKKETVFACEGENKKLSCPAGETLVIDDAYYGSTNDIQDCPCSCTKLNCRVEKSLPVVWKTCQGLQHCTVAAMYSFFCPSRCYSYRLARFLKVSYRCFAGCSDPLGMSSGHIPDDKITASSRTIDSYASYHGRLYGVTGAWTPASQIGAWLEVDLGGKNEVTGTIIQGRSGYRSVYWVTSYKLHYRAYKTTSWKTYTDTKGSEKVRLDQSSPPGADLVRQLKKTAVFSGNKDKDTPVTNLLHYPIDARYVRFVVQSWNTWSSMRAEILGCNDDCQVKASERYSCGSTEYTTAFQCRQQGCCFDSSASDVKKRCFWSKTKKDCPIGDYVRFKGVCYKSFTDPKTRDGAKQECAADGGMLAMPKDSVLNDFLYYLTPRDSGRWIGLTDANSDGEWIFEDGQALMKSDFSNWFTGEPKPHNGHSGCAVYKPGHFWTEHSCNLPSKGFVCQLKAGSEIRQYTSLGCWSYRRSRFDSSVPAIPSLERTDPRLTDRHHRYRHNPIKKCYQVTLSRGYTVFGVMDSGVCLSSADAHITYSKHGPSTECTADGEGGLSAISVYQITSLSAKFAGHNPLLYDNLSVNPSVTVGLVNLEFSGAVLPSEESQRGFLESCLTPRSSNNTADPTAPPRGSRSTEKNLMVVMKGRKRWRAAIGTEGSSTQ